MFPVSDLEDLYCRYTNNTVFVLDTADTCGVSEVCTLRLLCPGYTRFLSIVVAGVHAYLSVHVCLGYAPISQYTCVRGTRVSLSTPVSGVHAYFSVHLCPGYTHISQYTCVRGTRVSFSTPVSMALIFRVHVCP